MGKRLLITGGAGFVGSSLALLFREAYPDWQIVCFDNLRRRGSELNLSRLQRRGIRFCHGDVRHCSDLEAVGKVDRIIECSAEPSALAGFDGAASYVVDTNLVGTVNCLEMARRDQAELIFLSTSRVYPYEALNELPFQETPTRFEWCADRARAGLSDQGVTEEFPLEGARTLYGATKLCAELLIREYVSMYDVRAIINRCGVLTGPWQMGKVDQGFPVLWAARHHFGGTLSYIGFGGSGKQVRDLMHVEDLFELLQHQWGHLAIHNGQVYNVGGKRIQRVATGVDGSLPAGPGKDDSRSQRGLDQTGRRTHLSHRHVEGAGGGRMEAALDCRTHRRQHRRLDSGPRRGAQAGVGALTSAAPARGPVHTSQRIGEGSSEGRIYCSRFAR